MNMNKYKMIVNKIATNYKLHEESKLYTCHNLYNLNEGLYIEVRQDIENAVQFDPDEEFAPDVYLTKKGNRVLRIIENIVSTVYGIEF